MHSLPWPPQVEAHEGTIYVKSKVGSGATFYFTLKVSFCLCVGVGMGVWGGRGELLADVPLGSESVLLQPSQSSPKGPGEFGPSAELPP